ncbi:MAG: hypothetical protein KJ065_04715 [Anaerolineae bacterium]|nr:hypothetical protein [Anaerolineae bacterium]
MMRPYRHPETLYNPWFLFHAIALGCHRAGHAAAGPYNIVVTFYEPVNDFDTFALKYSYEFC